MSPIESLNQAITSTLGKLYGATPSPDQIQIQKTRAEFAGHYTLVVFPLLKLSRKKPEDTATEIGTSLKAEFPWITDFNVVKGFLNLSLSTALWLELLSTIDGDSAWGHTAVTEQSPLVMVEYSSPNTNKPLHLGHVRNNLLGNSLARILTANGKRVVKTNIVNDRGIHICKSMLAWQKWGNGITPESAGKKGDHLVGDFYVAFDKHYKAEVADLMAQGMTKEEAESEAKKRGWNIKEDAGRGYRRVVASPKPKEIVELSAIKAMSDAGELVICCGGGGIPVVSEGKHLAGAAAVIDKDFAAALLAESLEADMLIILTAVEKVAIRYGKPDQEWLTDLSVEEAQKYADQGEFAPGSMLPKVQAAIQFASAKKGNEAMITLLEKAREALQGKTGTKITKK